MFINGGCPGGRKATVCEIRGAVEGGCKDFACACVGIAIPLGTENSIWREVGSCEIPFGYPR
jgi:hypothetical protein